MLFWLLNYFNNLYTSNAIEDVPVDHTRNLISLIPAGGLNEYATLVVPLPEGTSVSVVDPVPNAMVLTAAPDAPVTV